MLFEASRIIFLLLISLDTVIIPSVQIFEHFIFRDFMSIVFPYCM